jgi:hypothetical protein
VYSDENDVLLWEHDFFPSFRVSSVVIGGEKEEKEIKLGEIAKYGDQWMLACEIEARPKNRKYVVHSRYFRA